MFRHLPFGIPHGYAGLLGSTTAGVLVTIAGLLLDVWYAFGTQAVCRGLFDRLTWRAVESPLFASFPH